MAAMDKLVMTIAGGARDVALQLYRRDRDHYVRLLEPYTVGNFLIDIPDFDCELFSIKDGTLVLMPAGERHCDGATFAPDKIGDLDFACAYIAHDFWYEMIDCMARDAAFVRAGFDAERLRWIGDAILAAQMKRKSGLWARVYYFAVRTFGGLFHRLGLASFALFFLSLAALSGCAGCAELPDGVFDPNDSDPVYETLPREALTHGP